MEIGQYFNYSTVGVCQLVDITIKTVLGTQNTYYVFEPIAEKTTKLAVPVDSEKLLAEIHPILSKEEIMELIHTIPTNNPEWIKSDRERNETFRRILETGTHAELVGMINSIHNRAVELKPLGRHLRVSDEIMLKNAKTKLYSEIAHVIGIEICNVEQYIAAVISNTNA